MIIGITMGDSSGVGPEILLQSAAAGQLRQPFVVFGDLTVLDRSNRELGFGVRLRRAASAADYQPDAVNVMDLAQMRPEDITPGRLNARSGAAARAYVVAAAQAALAGEINAMVTLPMNKEATQLSDPRFTGHTELIGEVCGADDVTIMLASRQLVVTHVSTHCSLREAIERAKLDRIRIIELTCDAVQRLKPNPRIAVAGLNPHAGENGMFGREEIEEIRPAVEWAQARGRPVEGPFSPDTISTSPCGVRSTTRSFARTTTRAISPRSFWTSKAASTSRWACLSSAPPWITEPLLTLPGRERPRRPVW